MTVALVRWSLQWPHRDIKQYWANFATVLAGVFAITALILGLALLQQRRIRLSALASGFAIAVAVGFLAFAPLHAATY